jgi:hypothetical protein
MFDTISSTDAFVDGNVKGMYFFGYGNFVSTAATVGFNFSRHIGAVGGYQLGSHLAIHGTKQSPGRSSNATWSYRWIGV